MIKKTLATVIMLSSFAFSSTVMAAGLSDDMKALGKNYKAFNQAENPQAATMALNNMRTAAVHSKQYKLAANTTDKVATSSALFDQIIVETVGVGQSEVEVASLADTTVVVLVPEAGDEVQMMKSGLMEVADLFVVNKSDRPDAQTFINQMLMDG